MRTHAAAGALLLVLSTACGGGLSRSELVAKGDAICKRINTRMAKEPDPKTTKDLQRLADRTIELSDPAIEDLQELEPPSDLEAEFKTFLASLKRQRDLTKELGEAAGKDDTAKVQDLLGDARRAQDEYRRVTGKIGFKECGGGV